MNSNSPDYKLQHPTSNDPPQDSSDIKLKFRIVSSKEEKRVSPYQLNRRNRHRAGTYLTAPRLVSDPPLNIRCYGYDKSTKFWCVNDVMRHVCNLRYNADKTLDDLWFPKERIMTFKASTNEGHPKGNAFGVIDDEGMKILHQCFVAKSGPDERACWSERLEKLKALMKIEWKSSN